MAKKQEEKQEKELTKAEKIALQKKELEKKYGKGTLIGGNDGGMNVEVISTNSIGLDNALGIGGLPKGRIVEIYGTESSGKTTLCLELIAKAHEKPDVYAAFVDAEHALSRTYCEQLGIDMSRLEISQPDYGEQALDITETLIKSGIYDIVVVDSVAALTPLKEIEGEMGDSTMGVQARMMNQALRKLTAITSKSNTCLIFINQLRDKIGVMFGCFHYDARVILADGSSEKIGKLVNSKKKVKVLSYNKETKKIEPKSVTNWFNNGKAKNFYQFVVNNPHGSGKSNLPIGDDHIIFTPKGETLASNLKIGDSVYIKSFKYLNDIQEQVVIGSLLGDGSIKVSKNDIVGKLRIKHSEKQNDYCIWKKSLFNENFISSFNYDSKNRFWFDTKHTSELIGFSKYKSGSAIRFLDKDIVSKIDILAIAIWYLDDGNFSGSYKKWGNGKSRIYCTKIDDVSKELICNRFVELGFPKPSVDKKGFIFYGEDNFKFQNKIKDYIPVCMDYKLHPKLRGGQRILFDNTNFPTNCLIETTILKIYNKPKSKKTYKFDIEVEDNHNYFVDNILVHNSPETTTGGNGLKFYSSIRLDVRRSTTNANSVMQGDLKMGNQTTVKVIKNKLAPPFRQASFDILYGEGIDVYGEVIDLGVEYDVINKSGSWFSYKDNKIGQGREGVIAFFKDNEEFFKEIKEKVIFAMKPKEFTPTKEELEVQEKD